MLLEIEVNLGPSGHTLHLLFPHPPPPAEHPNGDQDQSEYEENRQDHIYNNAQVRTGDFNKEGYSDQEYDHEKADDGNYGSDDRCPVVQGGGEFHRVIDKGLAGLKILKEKIMIIKQVVTPLI